MRRGALIAFLTLLAAGPAAGSPWALSPEAEHLRRWLTVGSGRPALGAQWNGGNRAVGWRDQSVVSGREPLVFGIEYYDYGPIEKRLDAREQGAAYAREKFEAGGIVTIVDHMPNPVTGGDAWDRRGDALSAVLPGGAHHGAFVSYLDRVAVFLSGLEARGLRIPVLYRPLHEMNGRWFWWGDPASGERFVRLWRFMHDYLSREKGLSNVLWVWSPNVEPRATVARMETYWPGDEYVDVVGLDGYDNTATPDFAGERFQSSYRAVSGIAGRVGLPVAWTEAGFRHGAQEIAGFWDGTVLQALRAHYGGARYVLVWNAEWGPRAGTPAAESFRRLAESGFFLHLDDVAGDELYGPRFAGEGAQ